MITYNFSKLTRYFSTIHRFFVNLTDLSINILQKYLLNKHFKKVSLFCKFNRHYRKINQQIWYDYKKAVNSSEISINLQNFDAATILTYGTSKCNILNDTFNNQKYGK